MPATEANTLVVGADGYEYMISGRMGTCRHDVWGLASRFGIDEENETLLYIVTKNETYYNIYITTKQ
jgi:hypothetical protein